MRHDARKYSYISKKKTIFLFQKTFRHHSKLFKNWNDCTLKLHFPSSILQNSQSSFEWSARYEIISFQIFHFLSHSNCFKKWKFFEIKFQTTEFHACVTKCNQFAFEKLSYFAGIFRLSFFVTKMNYDCQR